MRLGQFATAKEASLSVALEGWAVAERTSEEVLQQAQAENKTLLKAENKTGYYGVYHKPGRNKPYRAQVWRGGKDSSLGYFATAEEAALCIVRSPEGRAADGTKERGEPTCHHVTTESTGSTGVESRTNIAM